MEIIVWGHELDLQKKLAFTEDFQGEFVYFTLWNVSHNLRKINLYFSVLCEKILASQLYFAKLTIK